MFFLSQSLTNDTFKLVQHHFSLFFVTACCIVCSHVMLFKKQYGRRQNSFHGTAGFWIHYQNNPDASDVRDGTWMSQPPLVPRNKNWHDFNTWLIRAPLQLCQQWPWHSQSQSHLFQWRRAKSSRVSRWAASRTKWKYRFKKSHSGRKRQLTVHLNINWRPRSNARLK